MSNLQYIYFSRKDSRCEKEANGFFFKQIVCVGPRKLRFSQHKFRFAGERLVSHLCRVFWIFLFMQTLQSAAVRWCVNASWALKLECAYKSISTSWHNLRFYHNDPHPFRSKWFNILQLQRHRFPFTVDSILCIGFRAQCNYNTDYPHPHPPPILFSVSLSSLGRVSITNSPCSFNLCFGTWFIYF